MKKKCGAKIEIYSRVVGFFRPVQEWNVGKKQEFKERKTYCIKKEEIEKENNKWDK